MPRIVPKKWSVASGAGTVLVVLSSFIIGFFNFAIFFWLGIPIFTLLIGVILVWSGRSGTRSKILVTLIPVPMVSFSFFLFYLLLPKAEPETFLIPHKFRGQLVVKFDEPCGQSGVYEDRRRIYQIPDTGILITKLERTMGVIDRRFYLVNDEGGRTEISEFHWDSFEKEQLDWHWIISRSTISKDQVGVFWAYDKDFAFVISDYRSLEGITKETKGERRKSFQRHLESALNECRQVNLE